MFLPQIRRFEKGLRFSHSSPQLSPMSHESPPPAATGFEWRTNATWMGFPWIHVAVGQSESGQLRVARGIFALGQRAQGFCAVGMIATGFFSIGILSFGMFSAGIVSVGLFGAAGLNAFGPFAYGLCAVGVRVGGPAPFELRF